ncbi:MAG: GDSL-type esterase/lipase family protein [Thermoplasmata archaeon]|nr:GDSL-type esterase/lipase family protein [Thermoplasmata archaeon]
MTDRIRTIVALGDSTTAGTPAFLSPLEAPPNGRGDSESQYGYWVNRAHPTWVVLNRGVNGERTDQILGRVPRDVVTERPDYLVVLAGVNDVYQGRSFEAIRANLLTIYRVAGVPPGRTVAATILPFNSMRFEQAEKIRSLNTWILEEGARNGLLVCDTNQAVRDRNNPDRLGSTRDGLHPDKAGYRAMGEAVARVIERAESSLSSPQRPRLGRFGRRVRSSAPLVLHPSGSR